MIKNALDLCLSSLLTAISFLIDHASNGDDNVNKRNVNPSSSSSSSSSSSVASDPNHSKSLKKVPVTISTSVHVKIASRIYATPIKLPLSKYITISPELFQTLLELDYCAARFEFEFVRCVSRRIRTLKEADDVQLVTVLFSETLMWALTVKLLSVQQLADRDPCVLLALPRLSILVGCRLLPDSLIGSNRLAVGHRLPFMFKSSRSELAYLCRQLYALRPDQLCRLTRWLGPNGLPNLIYNQKLSTRLLSNSEQCTNSNCTLQEEVHNEMKATTTTATTTTTINTPHESRLSLLSLITTTNSIPNHLNISYHKNYIWKTYLPGLHRLYKCISSVADRFAREYPTELRFILQKVVEMHDTSDEMEDICESSNSSSSSPMNNNDNTNSQIVDTISSVNKTDNIVDKNVEEIKTKLLIDEENEFDEELELNMFDLIANESKLHNLTNLFNWNEVMQHHYHHCTKGSSSPNQFDVDKLFQESNTYLRSCTTRSNNNNNDKYSCSIDSTTSDCSIKSLETIHKHTEVISSDGMVVVVSEKSIPSSNNVTTTSTEQIVDEIGLDIAACLNDNNDAETLMISSNLNSISQVNNNNNNNQTSTFSQRLQVLNLSVSFEGTQNPTDHIFNYLPAWQPDSPPSYHQNQIDSLKIENGADDDDEQDNNDDVVVGHSCASCNRPFTLIRRRHHCRRCGYIFCSKCCNYWQSIEGLATNKPVRICSECHEFLNS
ncbi:unnamed protein product [Schistosoma turkestanicum]|nr:unnamed protein product [Schistosoma turkestanicum]